MIPPPMPAPAPPMPAPAPAGKRSAETSVEYGKRRKADAPSESAIEVPVEAAVDNLMTGVKEKVIVARSVLESTDALVPQLERSATAMVDAVNSMNDGQGY